VIVERVENVFQKFVCRVGIAGAVGCLIGQGSSFLFGK